jgi:K319L-like, PKD domain
MDREASNVKREACGKNWGVLVLLLCLGLAAQPAHAFKIVTPAENSKLKSGQSLTAQVDVGSDSGIIAVRYFWYPEQAETLVQQDESELAAGQSSNSIFVEKYFGRESVFGSVVAVPTLTSRGDATPPFGGNMKVPKEAIGPMRLLAVADISRGRLGTRSVFDETIVQVEPEAQLTNIDFETEKPLRLGRKGQLETYGQVDVLGKIFELPVVGEFADGITRPLNTPSSGTSYQSSNDNVIQVLQDGLLKIVGNGKTVITVTNRGKQASLDVIVEVGDEPNEPPIAVAGSNRTVKAGTKVELNGLKSTDPEGEALFYAWSQVRGSKVPLLDLNMQKASFVAPSVSEPKLFRFKLRVTDKKGADSLPAFVDVVVEP